MRKTESRCPDHPDAPHGFSILGETYCMECEWFTFDHEPPCPLAAPYLHDAYPSELECACEKD